MTKGVRKIDFNFMKKIDFKDIKKKLKRCWPIYVLILPGVLWMLILDYLPMFGIVMAWKDFRISKGIWGSEWVGWKHFIRFFQFKDVWTMFKNTIRINLIDLCTFPLSIFLALMLNEVGRRYKKVVQMLTYMPHFLTEVIVCTLAILFLDKNFGIINRLIEFCGGESFFFMGSPEAFPWIYVLSGTWQGLGWGTVLYMSALASVSSEHIEAAMIDGASRFQIVRYINFPAILPTVTISLIMKMGGLFGTSASKVLLLQNNLNLTTSNVVSLYTYNVGLIGGQFSYSAAIGLVNQLINLALLLIVNKIANKVTGSGFF